MNTAPWKVQPTYWVFLIPFVFLAAATLPRFDGLYGQDAYAYYTYATGTLRAFLLHGEPFPAFFWPPGYPLLVTLVSFVVGQTPLAGQIVSLAAATLVPIFTYKLAQELRPHDKWVPFAAALLVACTGQLWQSSLVVMTDTTGLAFATSGMFALARFGRNGRGRWLILATALLSYALLTRWAYGLVAIPATLYVLYLTVPSFEFRASSFRFQVSGFRSATLSLSVSQSLSLLFAAALTVLLIMSPVLYGLFTGQVDPATGHASFTGDLGVVSWNPFTAFQREFVTADGVLQYRFPTGLFYAMTPAFPYYFTPLLAWLIFPGLWVLLKERAAAPLFLIVGWIVVAMGFLMGASYQNFRFSLVYLPPLAIAAALGLATLWHKLRAAPFTVHHSPSTIRNFLSLIFTLIIGLGFFAMLLSGTRHVNTYVTNKDRDLATVAWVENQTEPDANLICFGLTLTFQQYSRLHTYEIFHLQPADLAQLLAEDRPTYLLLDVNNIRQQWADLAPGHNLTWLEQHSTLAQTGQTGTYTLFRINNLP